MFVEGEGQLALRGAGTDPTATSLRVSLGSAVGKGPLGWGSAAPLSGLRLTSGPALRSAGRGRAAGGLLPSPAAAAVTRRALDSRPGSGVRARPQTGLGPGRGSLGAADAAASGDWERGRSKNVSYSSVFLPGPAPPLPPNKPFPIAQLADGRPLAPSQGSGPTLPCARQQTPRAASPSAAPAPGSRPRPRLQPPTSASPKGRALVLGCGGSRGVQAQSHRGHSQDARHPPWTGRGRGGGGGAPPARSR